MAKAELEDSAATRILIVEDVPDDAELMKWELRRTLGPCTFVRAQSEGDVVRALHLFGPDVVLTDHSLPQFNALDSLRVVQRELPGTPVLVVTGSLDEETAADYIKAGAVDYIVKQRLHRLGPAVRRALALRQALEDAADAEAALARSEQRFRRLVEHSSDVITLLDRDGRITYSSHSMHPTLGYEPGERIGHSVFELIHPDDRATAEPLLREVMAQPDRVARADVRGQRKDGSWRELEVVAVNRLEDAAVAAVVVTYHDVTDRKRAEEQLRRANNRLEAVVQASPLAIVSLDPDGIVQTWNPAAERLFGWTAQEVTGTLLPTVPAGDEPAFRESRRRVMQGEPLTGMEMVRKKKDGTTVTVNLFGAPLRDAAGRVTGVLGLMEDVTGVKRLEQQFFQAQKMEAVGRLAGGVAHDFNNLLTAILGSTDLLLETLPPDHPGREDALETRKAALRAADLTRQLLAFSRQQVLAPRVLSLNDVVSEMHKMLHRLIGEDVELRTVLGENLGAARADPGQIEQVVVNLAVNARDAMPNGGRLTIETANVDLDDGYAAEHTVVVPGRYVMLAVSDTGMGMDAATKARVFEPFFTTKPKGKGTGLGLATVYGIVKQSGGYVWVYSEPGQGTSLKIYLPRVDAPVEASSPAHPATGSLAGSETVLVVEDQEEVRRLTRRILEGRGYRVLVAASGPEALRLAEHQAGGIDLLVTDVVMPGMSGRELGLLLGPARPRMKVLYVSGYTDESIVHHGVLEPGVAFMQKPFSAEGLARKVREVLDAPEPA